MDIIILAIDYLPQDWSQFEEGLVLHVIAEPRLDLNAIFRLSAEVLRHIVDDDDPLLLRKSIPDATGVSPEETCTVVQVKSFGKYFCFGLV